MAVVIVLYDIGNTTLKDDQVLTYTIMYTESANMITKSDINFPVLLKNSHLWLVKIEESPWM